MRELLFRYIDALLKKQITDKQDSNFGAIFCDSCQSFHSRAGEAVFPLAICLKESGEEKYLSAAISLGNWLISKQETDGSWKEAPYEWKGPTVFQLLSLAAVYPIIQKRLTETERKNWKHSIHDTAWWIIRKLPKKHININYHICAAPSLLLAGRILENARMIKRAQFFLSRALKKINSEGFITGEGHAHRFAGRTGVDLGYNLDMSLGALALYAVLTKDHDLKQEVMRSLKTHLAFMYPDGSIDNSWGSRNYKWTLYGSKTAHGCQLVLGLMQGEDPQFASALQKSLKYLKTCDRNGLVGTGPHCWRDKEYVPCINPTFNRANAIAMGMHFSELTASVGQTKKNLDIPDGIRMWKTINVCLVKKNGMMATVSGYRPPLKEEAGIKAFMTNSLISLTSRKFHRGKLHSPTGGAITYLWDKDYGIVQASSQTEYLCVEPMNMPDIKRKDIKTITPHICVHDGKDFYTNLYDVNTRIKIHKNDDTCSLTCTGELKNEKFRRAGVSFQYDYIFESRKISKTVTLDAKKTYGVLEIVEPFIKKRHMKVEMQENSVILHSEKGICRLNLFSDHARLVHGRECEKYWCPLPCLYAYPVKIIIDGKQTYPVIIKYTIELISNA